MAQIGQAKTSACSAFLIEPKTLGELKDEIVRGQSVIAMTFELKFPTDLSGEVYAALNRFDAEVMAQDSKNLETTALIFATFNRSYQLFSRLQGFLGSNASVEPKQTLTKTERTLIAPSEKEFLRKAYAFISEFSANQDSTEAGQNLWHVAAIRMHLGHRQLAMWPVLPFYGVEEAFDFGREVKRCVPPSTDLLARYVFGLKALSSTFLKTEINADVTIRFVENILAQLQSYLPEIQRRSAERAVSIRMSERTPEGLMAILMFLARAANQTGEADLARLGFKAAINKFVPHERRERALSELNAISLLDEDAPNARKRIARYDLQAPHRRIIQAWKLLTLMSLGKDIPPTLEAQITKMYETINEKPKPFEVTWGRRKQTVTTIRKY